jgi:peroxiredoxin Q/BCP
MATALGAWLLASAGLARDDAKVELKVGDKAPAFQSVDDQGNTWKTSDHIGKKILVIYFYPADFTGGCTKQACGFRDDYKKLADKGVEVIGISGDSAKTHRLFKKHHNLPFTLLADENGAIAKKFGVPVGKGGDYDVKDLGIKVTRGVTIQRWTFVIGKDGKIGFKEEKVNALEDSKKILEALARLEK